MEVFADVGQSALAESNFNCAGVPEVWRNVVIDLGWGNRRFPVEEAAQQDGEFCPCDFFANAEASVALGIVVARAYAFLDGLSGPKVVGYVGQLRCRRGRQVTNE